MVWVGFITVILLGLAFLSWGIVLSRIAYLLGGGPEWVALSAILAGLTLLYVAYLNAPFTLILK